MSTNAIHAALQVYDGYPSRIRPYLLRADTHPVIRSILTKSGLVVLIDILSRAPVSDPARPIKVRVDNIADKLDRSEKTVQRVIRQLQTIGWLLPSPTHDGRNYRGRYSHREFLVGDELRGMLGLPVTSSQTAMSDGDAEIKCESDIASVVEPEIELVVPQMSDGHKGVNKVFKEVALKEASAETPEKQKTSRQLPFDLIPMQQATLLSTGGICKLMKIAAEHKLRLQDVWIAAEKRILKAKALYGRAYRYLLTLIQSGEDFTGMAEQAKRSSTSVKTSIDPDKAYWHKRFAGRNGLKVKIFDGVAELTHDSRNYQTLSAREMPPIYEAIRSGALREIED